MGARFYAEYLIETPFDIESVALEMLGEQSTSTHTKVAGETPELVERHGARLESIVRFEPVAHPSLSSGFSSYGSYQRARITASWPILNIGSSISMLWTLLGNQVGMRGLTGIRLEHLSLPTEFVNQTPRPQFGIRGTRSLTGVLDRPLIGSIVKPNIGLTPEETGAAARAMIEGGLDFIKDDELIADPPYSPLADRVKAVMREVNRAADRTGRKVMYAFNISDDVDKMKCHHDAVLAAGGTCVMVNVNGVGFGGLIEVRKHSGVAIHVHRAGWAALTRAPMLGVGYQPFQAICRAAGADHMHVSGLGRKFWEDERGIMANAKSLLEPLGGDRDDRAMPVFSGGSTVVDVAATFAGAETIDLIMTSGGGIMAHPAGVAAGCRSMKQAWAAAVSGIALDAYAEDHPDLATAVMQVRNARAARPAWIDPR